MHRFSYRSWPMTICLSLVSVQMPVTATTVLNASPHGATSTAPAPTVQQLHLKAGQPILLPLADTAGQYWVVELETTLPLSAQLLDSHAQLQRQFTLQAGKQSLHLLLSEPGQQLRLQSAQNTAVLMRFAAKYNEIAQAVQAPEEPLLLPLWQAAHSGKDWQSGWQQLKQHSIPLQTELPDGNYRVTFLYQGASRNVRLLGGPSSDHDWLTQLPGTDLWYSSYIVPPGTRLSYKLAPDVPDIAAPAREKRVAILATAQRDPLNPLLFPVGETDKYQQSSVLALPKAPAQPGSEQPVALTGKADSLTFHSKLLANSRRIDLYQSSNYVAGKPGNIRLIAFDGPRYQQQINTPAIVEYLSQQGLIPPVQLVLIDPIDNETRAAELPDNVLFGRMLVEELLPQLNRQFGASFNATHTVLTGSSFGGLASLQLAWRYPEKFGKVIAKSPSLWWDNLDAPATAGSYLVTERYLTSPKLPLELFISAGIYESAHGAQGDKGILDGSRNLKDVLRAKGYPVIYREYAAGHDYLAWRGVLADGLIALFAK